MNTYPSGSLIAGRYQVAGRPLMGGMGIVYLCMDHQEDRPVALKTFRPEFLPDRTARDRFLREGTTWVDLGRHPHIVRCYSVEHIGDGREVYLALELVAHEQGRWDASLRSWLTPGQPLPVEQALLFGLQIARGMRHACEQIPGFVHRDLKPENVLVGADQLTSLGENRLRVTDFGLANILQATGEQIPSLSKPPDSDSRPAFSRTQLTHGIVGTPLYMAPEQWQEKALGIWTDIYALGCILYEMLTGQFAVEAHTQKALKRAHCEGEIRSFPASLPTVAQRVVESCLHLKPEERYQTWAELETALGAAWEEISDQKLPPAEATQELDREERVAMGWSYSNMGAGYLDIGKAEVAKEYFERARDLGQREGEPLLEGAALGNLGSAYVQLGDARRAIGYYEQALVIDRDIGDRRGEGADLGNLGSAYADLGDARRAIGYHEQALVLSREIGDRRGEGNDLGNLGSAYLQLGDARRAIGYYEQQLKIAREIGDRRGEGAALGNLGSAYRELGDARRAIGYYEQALVIDREIGDLRGVAIDSFNMALLYQQEGEPERALALAQEAAAAFGKIGHAPNAQRAQQLVTQLQGGEAPSNLNQAQILENFNPLIDAVVNATKGNRQAQAAVEAAFEQLHQNGWQISDPIKQIWQGERDEAKLIEGIDSNSAVIITEILKRL